MNSCFDRVQGGNCTLYIHRSFRNDVFEQALLDCEEKLRERFQLTKVQSSKFARVYKLSVSFNGVNKGVYFKQYLCRSIWDFVKDFVRAGRAERAYKADEMLSKNGFDVSTIIALGKFKRGFCYVTNFLVTLEIEEAKQIYQFIPDLRKDSKVSTKDKRELIRAFGQVVGRMHDKGIFHGDLRLGNVLAKHEKDRWRFFFLDNERTRKFQRLPARLRVKNLVQVNMFRHTAVSNTDRMRFFKQYWLEHNGSEFEKVALIKEVLKKTKRRLGKKKKAGGQLLL